MACSLNSDPANIVDALAPIGATPEIFIASDDSPTARIVVAFLGGAALAVTANGHVQLTPLKGGPNNLVLTVAGVNHANDDLKLMEDCGGGVTRLVKRKFAGAGPGGGANPVVGFVIQAS